MPFFKYNNNSCYYEEHGEGMPVIFLHGNTASSKMFYNMIKPLSNNFKVILIDFLGHGQSDRVEKLHTDLWYDEALQVISFIEQAKYKKVYLVGSSGGALVAINVALERPDLVDKVIADSFEGEEPLKGFTENIVANRAASKQNKMAQGFYYAMHGNDWESIVDNDTYAIAEHAKSIGKYFHKPLNMLDSDILLTGTKEDEFFSILGADYLFNTYSSMAEKIGHGKIHIFEKGGHPAMLSNLEAFVKIAIEFLDK